MTLPDLSRRMGKPDDFELLYSICKQALREEVERHFGPWDEAEQRDRFFRSTDPATHEMFFLKGAPVGYWWVVRQAKEFRLQRITLLPRYQKQGLGTALIRELIAEANPLPVRLHVFLNNPAARLYRRLGFTEEARTETHLHMVREGLRNS